MTGKLETVVRPFQIGDIFSARVLPPAQPLTTTAEPVVAIWGKEISLQATALGIHNWKIGVIHNEISRTTITKRVTNPTDASQYVDVQAIKTLRTKDENGVEQSFNFNPG
jgi:hypothetical protein